VIAAYPEMGDRVTAGMSIVPRVPVPGWLALEDLGLSVQSVQPGEL
jgi:hypothetical protein